MAITFNNDRAPAHIITRTNAGALSADLATVAAFDYFPNSITVGDAIYFSCAHAGLPGSGIAQKALGQFRNIKLQVGTALAAASVTLVWEYFADIAAGGDGMTFNYANTHWRTLTVSDTNPFSSTGTKTVSFTPPNDWINSYYSNPVVGNEYNAWVRCRVTAVSSPTEGGANATNPVLVGDNQITVTGALNTGTATSGAATTLTRTGAGWTVNAYANRIVSIISGTGAGQYRKVVSNTATVLTVDYAWTTNPSSDSVYVIMYNFDDVWAAHNTGSWGVITNPAMNFYILEHVALGIGDNATTPGYLEIRNYTVRAQNWRLCGGHFSAKNTSIFQCGYKNSQGFGVEGPILELLPVSNNTEHGVCLNNFNCHDTATVRLLGSIVRHPKQQASALGANSYVGYGGAQTYFYKDATIEEVDHTYDYCVALCDGPNTSFTRVNLKNAAYGFRTLADIPTVLSDISFTGQTGQLIYIGNTSSATFKNPIIAANNNPTQAILFQGVPSFDGFGGANTLTLLNSAKVDFNTYSFNELGTLDYKFEGDVNIKNSGGNFAGAKVGFWDLSGANVTWATTDASGNIPQQQLFLKTITHTAGSLATRTITDKTPHKYKVMNYGYKYVSDSKTASASFKDSKTIEVDPYVTLSEAAANALTGISINWGTKVITVSGTRTINELYDYCKAQNILDATNAFYDQPLLTTDGVNFALNGYTLTITGSLTGLTKVLTGTKTISTGGFFEDSTGAIWNTSGTLYYGSHIYYNIKALNGGANIAGALVAHIDANGADKTYNTSKVNGALSTDASGNVEGYAVWKVGSTVTSAQTLQIGEYNYQWLSIPKTVTGTAIGSSGSYETQRLVTDTQVTITKANALLVSGITVTGSTKHIVLSDEYLTAAYDNLKARQAAVATIESGVKGYMNYYAYGLLITKDGVTYTLKNDWEYSEWRTDETGTFRGGMVMFITAGTYSLNFWDNRFEMEDDGTYDFRNADIQGTVNLVNASAGNITVKLHPDHLYTNTGPNITVESSVAIVIQVNGMTNGSRYQLYDVTNDEELVNEVDADGTASYNYTYSTPTTIRLRVMYQSGTTAKQWYEVTGLTSATGLTFNVNQTDNLVYSNNNIDGSTVTECSVTGTTLRIYIDDPDNTTTAQRIYNWYQYYLSTELGIRNQDGDYISSTDQTHYTYNDDMRIINQDTVNPLQITGANIVPETGSATAVFDVTNGASIILNFNRVEAFVYSTGSGLSTAQNNKLMGLPEASVVADAVLDEALSGHTTAGTLGKKITDIPTSGGGATAEEVRIEMDTNSQIAKDAKMAKLNTF